MSTFTQIMVNLIIYLDFGNLYWISVDSETVKNVNEIVIIPKNSSKLGHIICLHII